jgi:hypothetical protein
MAFPRRASVLALAAIGLAACTTPNPPRPDGVPGAVHFLVAMQQPGGLFRYGYDLETGAPLPGDNIVRQAGAAFGLADYYACSRDASVRRPLIAALEALVRLSIPVDGGGWLVSADGSSERAFAGASALALLTELRFYRTSGDGRFATVRQAWAQGLLSLEIDGAGFRQTPAASQGSGYYNGEIWLALAYLEATKGDPGLSQRLSGIDRALMGIYGDRPAIGFYHWGAMAADVRFARSGEVRFARFAAEQTRAFLDRLRPEVNPNANACYALEGLIPALGLLDPGGADKDLHDRVRGRIEAELAKLPALQVAAARPEFAGAFRGGLDRPDIRIDHTQHCLSALIRARQTGLADGP